MTLEELETRIVALEQRLNDSSLQQITPYDYDTRVPAAQNVEWVSSTSLTGGSTCVTLRWIKPNDQTIDRFEVWVGRLNSTEETPVHVISVDDSPATFTVKSDQNGSAVAYIITVLKSGLRTELRAAPTVTLPVYGGFLGSFVDRGDPSAADKSSWTQDSNWYDWDLSSIVPAGAKAVLISYNLSHTVAAAWFQVREKGNSNNFNVDGALASLANTTYVGSVITACDTNRVIQYRMSACTLGAVVRGWWL